MKIKETLLPIVTHKTILQTVLRHIESIETPQDQLYEELQKLVETNERLFRYAATVARYSDDPSTFRQGFLLAYQLLSLQALTDSLEEMER